MLKIAERFQTALFGLAFGAVCALPGTAMADAPQVHGQPSVTGSAEKPIVVAQNAEPAAAEVPPGLVGRPERPARPASPRSNGTEPLSERAAAAAARAQRALAEEDNSSFDGSTPTQTDLVIADEPAPTAESPAVPAAASQPVSADQKRRASANLQPGQGASPHPSATCIAGCN